VSIHFAGISNQKQERPIPIFCYEIRIKHACKLLIESKLSISQIINECGFVNYANFFRYFKMLTGKTPAEYQKLNNDNLITEK